ncbi:MAG: hypothetical protein NTV55_14375, partial [Planctomycetota bacterium]|nr:hypothetical protein [Planctomycetota bacterium]
MPSPDHVNQFLSALKQQGGSAGNVMLREALGWDEAIYDAVRGEAISQSKVAAGRGRGGSVKLVGAESAQAQLAFDDAPVEKKTTAKLVKEKPAPPSLPATKPADQSLSAFIWSVADLLRGDYKQSEYG